MRRCHRSAAHAAVQTARQSRINVTARCGNLRLELEVRCYTPGGEIRHFSAVCVLKLRKIAFAERNTLVRCSEHGFAICLADEYGRNVAVRRHIDQIALYVVVNDDGLRTGVLRIVLLLREGENFAVLLACALNQRDFAREGLAGEIGRCTDTADHIRIGAVQACDLLGSCFCRVAVPNLSVTDQKIRRGGFYVVHACDGKRRVIRRRRCDRTVIRIGRQRQVSAALALVGRAVLIAGRTHQADTRILYPLVDLLHLGFGSFREACGQAETHVDGIRTQHDGILKCRKNIRVVRTAAVIAEDLHDHQLGIRSNTRYLAAVCTDNARNVRAV